MPTLIITVRFHHGRYHGHPEWPPSPARLFQALVAGAARGARIADDDARALEWLERIEASPLIAAPVVREGSGYTNFVPNNDLDAVGGDPKRVGEIRAGKQVKPLLFHAETPLLYLWRFEEAGAARAQAQHICALAERLYQLGRGVDMAWASGEIVEDEEVETRLDRHVVAHGGVIHRPSGAGKGLALSAPLKGSLRSLEERHKAQSAKFETVHLNRAEQTLFRQPPKPRFRQVVYDSAPLRWLFDLVGANSVQPLARTAALTESIRDKGAARLVCALPARSAEIERCLIGRAAVEADKAQRVRITPLPSIGHPKTSPAIRRVLIEIPANCPLRADDIAWAFSGLALEEPSVDADGVVGAELILVAADDCSMLRHYGVEDAQPARTWRTVTPVALPVARRRIAPERRREQAKGGAERAKEESGAADAVRQALRHAGVQARIATVRVQREPFGAKGEPAEAFAHGRFDKHRLWHVEIVFEAPQRGPLIVGDGRYLGLGLMHPVVQRPGVMALCAADAAPSAAHAGDLVRALRRAVMARVQAELGAGKQLPAYFTGHEADGGPARSGEHAHLAFAYDCSRGRLIVLAPHIIERRASARGERQHWRTLENALRDFTELRAGTLGVLRLKHAAVDLETDPLFAPSRAWESATPYRVTRHRHAGDARAALAADIAHECNRLHLPRVAVEALEARGVAGVGLFGRVRLTSAAAIAGPILIGRDRHFGGGLFAPA